MKPRHLLFAAALLPASPLRAQDAAEVTALLKALRSEQIETRRDAIAGLQTSLDPRIPDACLPLLSMEGDSIRRLAARAIGSRWHQIPKERVPVFTAALKRQVKGKDDDGLENMARRGIALLNREYTGPMVSRSGNRRWVIYERRGLPCLIDTRTMTEELLGYPNDARMLCAYGNTAVAPTVNWHPKKEMATISMIEDRHHTTVWLWVHGKGLHPDHLEAARGSARERRARRRRDLRRFRRLERRQPRPQTGILSQERRRLCQSRSSPPLEQRDREAERRVECRRAVIPASSSQSPPSSVFRTELRPPGRFNPGKTRTAGYERIP